MATFRTTIARPWPAGAPSWRAGTPEADSMVAGHRGVAVARRREQDRSAVVEGAAPEDAEGGAARLARWSRAGCCCCQIGAIRALGISRVIPVQIPLPHAPGEIDLCPEPRPQRRRPHRRDVRDP